MGAVLVDRSERIVEHVVPMKRIVVEIVDPAQVDPRSNSVVRPIAGGPALSPEALISIFDRLNCAGKIFQWDAPHGDGWVRCRQAGVVAYPLMAKWRRGPRSRDRRPEVILVHTVNGPQGDTQQSSPYERDRKGASRRPSTGLAPARH